ncbi:E3 ubiquitin- ligase DZIP3 [Paramuricea clavata]|uniref:E3 ubiquitin- ligase DZIP3 n=1 Tax=Paramuricea clavata TaxID=317549 RepID=A0A6S7LNH8_PARCT|nr:E3 ubiquitin- ligase DZIP3 [Paramuricea clavata]
MASPSQSLNDQANGARLSRLLVNKGTQALRAAFDFTYPPSTLTAVLNTNKAILQKLRYKVINTSQWKLLYPSSGPPDSQNFDVTLLTVLLRNICGLTRPASGWDTLPPDSDTSVAANIARIKFYRNQVHAHITTTEIADNEFENLWLKISKALIGLGIPKSELDELKEAPLSPEEAGCIQLLKDWCKSEAEMNVDVKEILAIIKEERAQKSRETEKVSDVDKLGKCDFSGIRKSLNDEFLPGTRQWLFDKLSSWFTDKNSDSTVMILTAGPGVGKSVFAAEVCRMYAEEGQLAACHFCQYKNSDYRDPRMIIESLASIMCENVKGFKAKLDEQLQRRHSRETLSDAFRVLLNDPLYALEEREPMLLVIDALDESMVAGKSELLELISEEFPKLPQWIKILITSRPELTVKKELHHLNTVQITRYDTKNKDDLLKYLRKSLSHICNDEKVFRSLAEKSEGSFLFAYYTQLELKETTKQLTIETISELVPKGIGGFYQKQLKHLENELNALSSSEVKLKRFLQILVAAEGPLPLSLLPEYLGLLDNIEYKVRQSIIGIMSSILPVYDNCLTVYHKSLRDWLMFDGYKEHDFTVDSQIGHECLWRVCKKVFDQIISLSTFSNFKPSPMTRYALVHGISHMIQSDSKTSYHLSVDVRIVLARMMNQIDCFEMEREWREIVDNSPSVLSSEMLQELDWHIKLFDYLIRGHFDYLLCEVSDCPSSYLQSVANRIDCSDEKGVLVRSLLEQGHHFWFEDLDATKLTNHFYKSVSLRTDVTCMCASSNEQLVAAGYKDGWISIFRVPDFQEVHTFDTMPESSACRSMLLRNRDYTLHTKSEFVGPLWSCSFSPSSVRLVTCDGSEKAKLWDVNSGNLLARLQAGGSVNCCSFSECGLFIVADKLRENFKNQTDVFSAWNALTLQRVDRRNIRGTQQRVDQGNRYSSFRFLPDRNNKSKLLLSRNGDYIDVFQLPDALPVARLYEPFFLFSPPLPLHTTTRSHWRNCVLHHTNESIKLTEVDQLNKGPLGYELCPCDFEKNRPGLVTVQKRYVVPFVNKLNIFSVADQPSMSIQPLFVSESYAISCCCFSPDGSLLATCANGAPLSVLIWDTKLCTVIQVLRFPLVCAEGCWWSESLLWIYDGGLVKILISNGRSLEPSGAQRVKIDWEPTKLLTFSDVLIFIDQKNSANVARIKNGELQYVEKLPIDNPILCAAVSPCNSIILMASTELTFHVWREDQTSQSLHWVASNTGELLDFPRMKGSEENVIYCKCCITSDNTKGVLALYFRERGLTVYPLSYDLILVDLSSKMMTRIIPCHDSMPRLVSEMGEFYAGNSYCIVVNRKRAWLGAVKLATGECVAEWMTSLELQFSPLIVAHSKNDLVAIIIQHPARVRFLKIVVPE